MIRHNQLKLFGITLRFMVLMWLAIPLAMADPPANDDFDSATTVPELPFTDSINTTEATTAFDDPDCVGQGPTVWYAFIPTEDMRIEANTFGSDYDTTLSVYTGSRGDLNQIACNDDTGSLQSRVRFDASAGETYFFMVGAFASGPGGNLVFTVDVAPPPLPPLETDLSIDPVGSFVPQTGVATIRGTVTCSRPASVSLSAELRQKIGRFIIQGFSDSFMECNGETPWTLTFSSGTGAFGGGPASISVSAFFFAGDDGDEGIFDQESAIVRLRGSRR